jgi:hypothetical protein
MRMSEIAEAEAAESEKGKSRAHDDPDADNNKYSSSERTSS